MQRYVPPDQARAVQVSVSGSSASSTGSTPEVQPLKALQLNKTPLRQVTHSPLTANPWNIFFLMLLKLCFSPTVFPARRPVSRVTSVPATRHRSGEEIWLAVRPRRRYLCCSTHSHFQLCQLCQFCTFSQSVRWYFFNCPILTLMQIKTT